MPKKNSTTKPTAEIPCGLICFHKHRKRLRLSYFFSLGGLGLYHPARSVGRDFHEASMNFQHGYMTWN